MCAILYMKLDYSYGFEQDHIGYYYILVLNLYFVITIAYREMYVCVCVCEEKRDHKRKENWLRKSAMKLSWASGNNWRKYVIRVSEGSLTGGAW